ncbi:MAG: SBBP repeat-containing protein [Gemmatimonadota bacterium]|nr:MAG: SBBP repeat-containing protein [Gemmatimonadota bacterium]
MKPWKILSCALIVGGIPVFFLVSFVDISHAHDSGTVVLNAETKHLVRDPLLASTFLGGSGSDGHYEVPMVLDDAGNVYVASRTNSTDFPVTPGVYDETHNGGYDVFVAKLSSDLSTLLACTFLGGGGEDGGWPGLALALDEDGHVFVAGITTSADFPTTAGAFDLDSNGGADLFVAKFDADLRNLLASTFLGGSGNDDYIQMTVDEEGNPYLTGATTSNDFPTTPGSYDETYNPGGARGYNVYVSRFDSDLEHLVASTFLSGSGDDVPEVILIDGQGNVFITGWAASTNFPTTENAYDRTYNGHYYDVFVSKFNNDLSTLSASTYIGGNSWEFGYGMTLDPDGNVYVTGHVASSNFPTTSDAFDETYNGTGGAGEGDDLFVSKFDNDLTTLLASTFLGGSNWENGQALKVDHRGYICVAGAASSPDIPISTCSYDATFNGGSRNQGDVIISIFDSNLELLTFSTYLGGSSNDNIGALVFDDNAHLYISGSTGSSDFPTTVGAYDESYNGGTFQWGGDVTLSIVSNGYWTDSDEDGALDACDNCPDIFNADQADADGDGNGDVCDMCPGSDDFSDVDGDNLPDGCDECTDTDGDGFGDPGYPANTCEEDKCPHLYSLAQEDADDDGRGDICDNCPDVANPDQHDGDDDGFGDACDSCTDTDGDGYGDPGYPANACQEDNCPNVYNPDQTEIDRGDVDCNGGIDVLDVLAVVNHILASAPLVGGPLDRADCNGDGGVNILDALGIINDILGLAECEPTVLRP